jgi:hypothetical protein
VQKWRRGNGWARLIDNAMIKAIARAFRWQEQLDTHATNAEIAAAEDHESYMGRVIRLTLLAPDIVQSILDARQLWRCS